MSWAAEAAPKPTNGAIYQAGREVALFENPAARHVGDIVTIVLNESTAAQKSSSTNTAKSTTDTLPGMTILGKALTVHGVPIMSNNISDAAKFAGEGDSAQSNSLQGFITVTVLKVLPNGNLFVKGEKWIGINQGEEYVRMTGVIRPSIWRRTIPSLPRKWPTRRSPTAAREPWRMPMPRAGCPGSSIHRGHRSDV